ncbi:MAG: NAD-dependent epimerase/dehydratase family protein [Verrucomicrobiota bacterium]
MFKKAFVTGGAGFIGSHIVDRLVELGVPVVVYDNFATGFRSYLAAHETSGAIEVVEGDVLDLEKLSGAMRGADAVFHFQANADVRGGMTQTRIDLEQNTIATWNVADAARSHGVKTFVFASSATVYGEPDRFPTPENHASEQTSLYGASKLACEAMLQAYTEYFGMRCFIFRFVSWIGERYSHGVIFDFLAKLKANPRRLEILGDGSQRKSYLYVRDGVDGIFTALERSTAPKNIFNLGHDQFIDVHEMAAAVIDGMGLQGVELHYTGGVRGWLGDSPLVHLDTSAIKRLGWTPKTSIRSGIEQTVQYLQRHPELLERRALLR